MQNSKFEFDSILWEKNLKFKILSTRHIFDILNKKFKIRKFHLSITRNIFFDRFHPYCDSQENSKWFRSANVYGKKKKFCKNSKFKNFIFRRNSIRNWKFEIKRSKRVESLAKYERQNPFSIIALPGDSSKRFKCLSLSLTPRFRFFPLGTTCYRCWFFSLPIRRKSPYRPIR